MKDIMLKIIGNQLSGLDDNVDQGDRLEFITEGQFMQKENALYLLYEESELSGMEGCTTSLKIFDGKVKMRRYGAKIGFDTAIEFEQGKKFKGYYGTPYGSIEMEILTNKIDNNITADGQGTLGIDCSISLKGLSESRNKLQIEIM